MRLFSKASEYAIRAMMSVLETGSFPSFGVKDSCKRAEIPEAYARKALQEMTKAGILKGVHGPRGGYMFMRKLSEISLLDIVLAVDGQYAFAECPMGLRCQTQLGNGGCLSCEHCTLSNPMCGLDHVCPMHELWREARKLVIGQLKCTTLHDIKDRLLESPETSNA